MSDADEIVQTLKEEGDTFKSDASEEPTNNDGKEIANKDSRDLQHQDNSEKVQDENLEGQVQTQFISGQDEVKTISGQDQASISGQYEDESDIGKDQGEASNGISGKALDNVDQVHVQENTSVENTVGTNVDEIRPQSNNDDKDRTMCEIGQIQIQSSDDGQSEAVSVSGNVESQSTSGECTEALNKSGQVEDQPIGGQKYKALNELGHVEDQSAICGQDKAYGDLEQVEGQSTRGQNLCDLGQVENHPTNGQDEAQSKKNQVQDQADRGCPPLSCPDEVQCKSGQDEDNDKNEDTKSSTSQVQLDDGSKVKAKGAMCKIKSQPTSGKTGLLTGKRFPAFTEEKRKITIQGSSRILAGAQAINTPGQAKAKNAPGKSKLKTKSIENVKLNAPVAEKVEPEPVQDKNCLSSEMINCTNDSQKSASEMTSADDKDQSLANRDVTESNVSGGLPASGGTLASKESKSVTMFWCDICKVFCTSALNLQMHFLGFKHKKIEAALKWNVNNAEGVTKDELLAPMETRTVEDHLSKMKLNKAVLGLDYVIEYRYDQKTNPQFVCKLCYCKSELTWFLPHLLGTKHMENYLEKHYPGSLNYEGEKLKPSEWKEFVNKKALEIEKKDGRGKVTVVLEKIVTKANEKSAVKRAAEQSIVEPEHKLQKSDATPDDTWNGVYLYPDGLPITLLLGPKLMSRSVHAHQGASTTCGAVTINDLQGSKGSKILEDHIKKSDIEESIIGLDFLTEYHYKGKTEPLYYCELCNCELPLRCILAHIFGLKHKINYVKRRHPELLKINAGKYKQIVKEKAAEIENIDGRGTVKVIRDYDGPPLSEKIAATKDVLGSQPPDMEYSSFDQDQSTDMETSHSSDPKKRKSYASTSSKPSGRVTSSRAGPRSDPKYSRYESSTSKGDQTRKRESSKEIRHSGEDWRDEWERSIKQSKSIKEDKRGEKSKHFVGDKDRRHESKWDSRDDYKNRDKFRGYRDDYCKGYDASYRVPEKYVSSKPEDVVQKEILRFLDNFKVINDRDARYVKGIVYKLSNRLLQFGQRAMQFTGSAEKLIEETKKPILADEHPIYESCRAGILRNYPDQPAIQNTAVSMSSIQNNLLTPSLLNSIRGMDENTITSTITRLAANNPAFEGIRISTLVTVLMEAGIGKKLN